MRLGIDVRYLSHGLVGGVHTYVRHLVPSLIEQAGVHTWFLYADRKRPLELPELLPGQVTVRYLPWHTPMSSIWNDLSMWREMARDHLDVAHFPANYGFGPPGARTAITLHDAINVLPLREIWRGHRKTPRTLGMMAYLHLCTKAALRRADLILTVSRFAAGEIARRSGVDASRIVPVPHAPTADLHRVEDPSALADVRRRHGLTRPFVLADALKNPSVLVRAWRMLPAELRESHRIVFFSRRPDPLPIVHQAAAAGEAHVLVRPSRADLIALYSQADAFVFPSWIEGFGIPVLEAMTCGAPVIASDRGAIPEVAGDAALYCDAEDAAGLARHVAQILDNPEVAESLRRLGFARAAQFSWEGTAGRVLQAYETLAAIPGSAFAPAVG